jgi:hypothetical protein
VRLVQYTLEDADLLMMRAASQRLMLTASALQRPKS